MPVKFQRRMRTTLVASLLALVTVYSVACEKKRRERFVQGDGEYVYTIDEFKGAKYKLVTGDKLTRGVTTKADEVVVDEKSSVLRSFDSVKFEVETDFGTFSDANMSNFQFFGKANSEYEVRVEFTEDNLVFFKVAPLDAIPSDEMTFAEKVEGDNYRVPLFGLPLSKFTVERIKDDRGKSTNQIRTYAKKFLSDSTHFAVKPANPKYFDTQLKLDMLPAKFFDEKNEWFFEVTVVDRPLDNNSVYELGNQIASGKARFLKTNKTLAIVSQNTPEELKDQDAEKQSTLLEIPAQWMDFQLIKSGDSAYLKEEVFNDIAAGAKYWKDREWVQLQFEKIITGVVSTDSVISGSLRVKRLEVADDYFSFIVFDALSKISFHFSFAKENTVNEGLNFPLEDVKRYGFFRQRRAILPDSLTTSEESSVKTTYLQRMYPKNNEIRFHFTANTPKDPLFIEAIEEAVKAWDAAFVEAAKGTEYESNPIRVTLDKVVPVQNGDARYHKVSFYGYEVESGLLGYGPSVKDGRNGEVYSSTNHIYLRNYREQILRNLVKYVRYRLGAYHDLGFQGITLPNQILITSADVDYDFSGVFNTPTGVSVGLSSPVASSFDALPTNAGAPGLYVSTSSDKDLTAPDAEAKAQLDALTDSYVNAKTEYQMGFRDYQKARARFEAGETDELGFKKEVQASVAKTNASTCDSMAGTALSFKEIEEICMQEGDAFKEYVDEIVSLNQTSGLDYRLDREKEVFYACAQKLMKPTLISTLVHEFGHNFGMTHNFAGTADAENFERDENGVPTVRSTSVMDYAHYDADRGYKPGTYDIATIRYGYYRGVEVLDPTTGESKGIVSIKSKNNDITSVDERVAKIAPDLVSRRFQYCYDTEIATGEVPLETPNCRRRDQGSDPVAQARAFIDGFNAYIITSANRFDNTGYFPATSIATSATNNFLNPMKLIYDTYRFSLYETAKSLPPKVAKDDPYFDNNTAKAIENLVIGPEALAEVEKLKAEILAQSGEAAKNLDNLAVIRTEKRVQSLPKIAQYKLASEFIKDFYRQIVFSNDMYCVALSSDASGYQAAEIIPFVNLRTSIYNANRKDAVRCEDASVLAYFREQAANGSFGGITAIDSVVSIGNPTVDILASADTSKLPLRQPVRTGLGLLRQNAINLFAYRSSDAAGLSLLRSKAFYPSVLDEENFRNEILTKISDRYINGIDGNEILSLVSAKVGKPVGPGVYAELINAPTGKFYLPFYEQESEIMRNLLASYKAGASSPKAADMSKTSNILITQQPEVTFLNFIRSAPDAAEYRYFIAGSTAYYSKGVAARNILASLSETYSNVTIAEQMVASQDASGNLLPGNTEQIRQRLKTFVTDYANELAAGDVTAKNVLYKVRACVKDRLVNKFQSKLQGYSLADDPDANYIQSVCRGSAAEGTQSESAAIAKYFAEAENLLDFIVSKDNQPLTMTLVNSILAQIGLPASPDVKKTWSQIRDSVVTKRIPNVTLPNAFESAVFTGLVNESLNTAGGPEKLLQIVQNPNALDSDITRLSKAYSNNLRTYAKYRDLYKKKVDIVQTAIYQAAR